MALVEGSGTDRLTFAYTVRFGDRGVSQVPADAIRLAEGATLVDVYGRSAAHGGAVVHVLQTVVDPRTRVMERFWQRAPFTDKGVLRGRGHDRVLGGVLAERLEGRDPLNPGQAYVAFLMGEAGAESLRTAALESPWRLMLFKRTASRSSSTHWSSSTSCSPGTWTSTGCGCRRTRCGPGSRWSTSTGARSITPNPSVMAPSPTGTTWSIPRPRPRSPTSGSFRRPPTAPRMAVARRWSWRCRSRCR